MFERLSDRLEGAFKVLSGNNKLTELNIAESIKEIRRALVDADVNYKIAKQFTDSVKEKGPGHRKCTKSRETWGTHGENRQRRTDPTNGW